MTPKQKLAEVKERILSEYVFAATSGRCGCYWKCSCYEQSQARKEAFAECLGILGITESEQQKALADFKEKNPKLFI